MSEHTPGPWRAGRMDTLSSDFTGDRMCKSVYVDDPDGEVHMGEKMPAEVARAYGALGADPRANALLIAAAPDLLEACELALNNLRDDIFPSTIEEIRAAIVKAGR